MFDLFDLCFCAFKFVYLERLSLTKRYCFQNIFLILLMLIDTEILYYFMLI